MSNRFPPPRRLPEAPRDPELSVDRIRIAGHFVCEDGHSFFSTYNEPACPICRSVGFPLQQRCFETGIDGREEWRDAEEVNDEADDDPWMDDDP
jgi:hypothetical protein